MRPLEVILFVVLALQALAIVFGRRKQLLPPLMVAGMGAWLAQWWVEGGRWQLWPAWALLGINTFALMLLFANRQRSDLPRTRTYFRFMLFTSSWIAAVFLPWTIPVFQLPDPTGPYGVGATWLEVEDSGRRLMLKLWYPAIITEHDRSEPYWPDAERMSRVMAGSWHMPSYIFSHLDKVKTNTYLGASPLEGPLPVIFFSHGYLQGYVNQNQGLIEELASHGYVVCSVTHPSECLGIQYLDGQFISYDEALGNQFNDEVSAFREALMPLAENPHFDPNSYASLAPLIPTVLERSDIWVDDMMIAFNACEKIQTGEFEHALTGRLDLTSVGAIGMSFGGAAAVEWSIVDDRVGAAVNLDGFHYGSTLSGAEITTPYLLFSSEVARRWRNDFALSHARNEAVWVLINQSQHFDFCDFAYFGRIYQWLGPLSPVGASQMHQIVDRSSRMFFDVHLRGESEAQFLAYLSDSDVCDVQVFSTDEQNMVR